MARRVSPGASLGSAWTQANQLGPSPDLRAPTPTGQGAPWNSWPGGRSQKAFGLHLRKPGAQCVGHGLRGDLNLYDSAFRASLPPNMQFIHTIQKAELGGPRQPWEGGRLWVGVGRYFCLRWVESARNCVTSDLHANLRDRFWNTTRRRRATPGHPVLRRAIQMFPGWVHAAIWPHSLFPTGSKCAGKLQSASKCSERLPERPAGLQEKHELSVVLTRGGIRPLTLPSWRSAG